MDNNMLRASKRIVIDPGHGGDDPGALKNNIIEKDYTLKISQYMYDRFKDLGIPVTLTRDSDITLSPTARTNRALSAYGNDKDVIVISNHLNAGGGDGAEVIYALRNTSNLSDRILNNLENAGQNVRKAYQRRLPSNTSKDYYFMHRDTGNTESVIVEYGFLDSTGDDVEQIKNNWEKYAEAVVKAVAEYAGVQYIPVTDNYYIVKPGDSLYAIALKYNTTVAELKTLNNLTTNALSIGQVLTIPSDNKEEENGNTYIVKSGDSLYSIALKTGTTVSELKTLNNLTSNILNIGQMLKLPSEEGVMENTYIVKSGDTLYGIALKTGTTVSELKALNNLTSNILSIGQVLKLPQKNNIGTTYTVKSGDTLYSIARKYGVTVDEIKKANNMSNNLLSLNQVLIIPQ